MHKVLIIHGPNLNLLGTRQPEVYGKATLEQINTNLKQQAEQSSIHIECYQSNNESDLIEKVQQSKKERIDWIIINPAALTHTSVALRDAIEAVETPFIEVHISNIYNREPFRRQSFFSDIAQGTISGLGPQGYELALKACINHLNQQKSK